MPAARVDTQVPVRLELEQWIRLMGYLEGVGMGDEMEHHGWIQAQLRPYLHPEGHDDE